MPLPWLQTACAKQQGRLASSYLACPRGQKTIGITLPQNKRRRRKYIWRFFPHAHVIVFSLVCLFIAPHYLFCAAAGTKVTGLPISSATHANTCPCPDEKGSAFARVNDHFCLNCSNPQCCVSLFIGCLYMAGDNTFSSSGLDLTKVDHKSEHRRDGCYSRAHRWWSVIIMKVHSRAVWGEGSESVIQSQTVTSHYIEALIYGLFYTSYVALMFL